MLPPWVLTISQRPLQALMCIAREATAGYTSMKLKTLPASCHYCHSRRSQSGDSPHRGSESAMPFGAASSTCASRSLCAGCTLMCAPGPGSSVDDEDSDEVDRADRMGAAGGSPDSAVVLSALVAVSIVAWHEALRANGASRRRAKAERLRRLRAREAAAMAAQCTAASNAPQPASCSGWPASKVLVACEPQTRKGCSVESAW